MAANDIASGGPLAPFGGQPIKGPDWFEQAIATPAESAWTQAGDARIHYLRWGDRKRPGLLLVHGNGAHAFWWSYIAPFLARDYNVAAMDISGMGDSAWRPSYRIEQFVDEQLAVMRHAGMFDHEEPPVIVAHSFGGFVTILTGALHGDKLAGTVIVDSPVNPPERAHHGPPRREIRPHRIYPTLAEALARFRLAPEQPWIGDTAERLRATKCRIALFRGESSVLMPAEVGDYMFNLLGRAAPVVEIPQARHHVMLDQQLAFVAALRALLADWNHSKPTRRV
ncbi:MAG: alpha/beta hydrolase [Alphaproteobacteria bacterium]|nr:alpha/beta hydrolase [Alphaproteobacteria bacterium]